MNQAATLDDTKQRLLDASRKLFSANGFDGASVRAITSLAEANLGAVTYHFGSKDALYEAVLDDLFLKLADKVSAAASQSVPSRDRLAAIVRAFFAFFDEYPEAPRILLRQLAADGQPPPHALASFRRIPETIIGVVQDGQARGELRAVKPLFASFTLVSQTVWFAVVRRAMASVTGIPMDRPELALLMEQHIADVVLRALTPEKGNP